MLTQSGSSLRQAYDLSEKKISKDSAEISSLIELLKDQLNAVVVCLSRSWGGLEQVAAHDAVDLASLGLKVRVLCLEGSPIHRYLQPRQKVGLIPLAFKPRNFMDFKLKSEISRLVHEGVNLIHSHQTSILGSVVPWLWNHPRVAFLATRHIMNNHNKKDFFHQALYSRVDALMVMSHTLKKNVLDTHSIRQKQVKVVNLGLDFDWFDPVTVDSSQQREAWGADPDTVIIGMVGRIDPAKGQATFIKAAAGTLKRRGPEEKFKFVIVGDETLGSSAQHLTELKEMLIQFRLEDTVIFAGFKSNIPEIMKSFDIFVMPSRQEAFGLVAIEAMAMECPIIISSGGSASEIVGQEEFGLTVRPDDAFDLQLKIRQLLDEPERRIEMGKRARQHVKDNFDRNMRILKTLNLFERALRRRRSL